MTKVFINGEFLEHEEARSLMMIEVTYLETVSMNIFVHTMESYLQLKNILRDF